MEAAHHSPPQRSPVLVRPERPADRQAIYEVERLAFGRNAEADLVERLRVACPEGLAFVAECDAGIVGHVLFTPVEIGSPDVRLRGMGLGPVGVLPDFQRQGIGTRLIEEGLETLRRAEVPWVVVLGDRAYYGRFGFQAASRFHIGCEFDGVPAEAFMAIIWKPEALVGASGVARYHPEFHTVA